MELEKVLLDEFAEITHDKKEKVEDVTCYGTAVLQESGDYVRLDAADDLTPATYTVAAHNGDRVLVMIKNHRATVIANITSPSLLLGTLQVTDGIYVQGYLTTNKDRTTYNDQSHYGLTFSAGGIGAYGGADKYWYVTNEGSLYANKADIAGTITAKSGFIGDSTNGFTIDTDGIYSGLRNNRSGTGDGNIALANSNFSRTINGTGHNDLRFAIGSNFGVSSSGVLYAASADISGTITATKGFIGNTTNGFTIDSDGFYSGPRNDRGTAATGNIAFSNTNFTRLINNVSRSDLRFAIGGSFGVGETGKLYAANAIISGEINASTGDIGGWKIAPTAIYRGGNSAEFNKSGTLYFGADGLSLGNTFTVDAQGSLKATKGTIGGWTIGDTAIYRANATVGTANASYFGLNGLSISNKFIVNSGGALTATEADITGAIKATSGTIGTGSNKILIGMDSNNTHAAIRYGMNNLADTTNNGFYIGTDGIALGKGAFSVTAAGVLSITGSIYANNGEIGGFVTDATSIHTKNMTVESNATNSLAISSSTFRRTIGYVPIGDLKMAIGDCFGITESGHIYTADSFSLIVPRPDTAAASILASMQFVVKNDSSTGYEDIGLLSGGVSVEGSEITDKSIGIDAGNAGITVHSVLVHTSPPLSGIVLAADTIEIHTDDGVYIRPRKHFGSSDTPADGKLTVSPGSSVYSISLRGSEASKRSGLYHSFADKWVWYIDVSQSLYPTEVITPMTVVTPNVKVSGYFYGAVDTQGKDINLTTSSSSSNDSGDLVWKYGNGNEKIRIWTANEYTAKAGPYYRVCNASGTSLYSGNLVLGDGTGASGTWGIGISGNAATSTVLRNYYDNRPTDANVLAAQVLGKGGLATIKATSSMTANKPASDGHILHFFWDNAGKWDAQLFIGNNGMMQYRTQPGSDTWTSWTTVLHSGNYSSYALPLSGGTMSGSITLNNGLYIYEKDTSGTARILAGINGDGDWFFGFGAKAASLRNTYFDGNNVYIRSNNDVTVQAVNLILSASGAVQRTIKVENNNASIALRVNADGNAAGLRGVKTAGSTSGRDIWLIHMASDGKIYLGGTSREAVKAFSGVSVSGRTVTFTSLNGDPTSITTQDTTYSFTNKGATLAWSTTSTIATVGGVDIKVTMPANPNTNTTYSAGSGLSLSSTTFSLGGTLTADTTTLTRSGNNNAILTVANNNAGVALRCNADGNSAGIRAIKTAGTSRDVWISYMNSSGGISHPTSSDRREKDVHGLISEDEALNVLRGVELINFSYKADELGLIQNGVVAQQVRDVLIANGIGYRSYMCLEAVDSGSFVYDLTTPEDRVRYSVDYSKFTPILWKGWQIHDDEITTLKTQIKELKAEIAALKGAA